MAGRAFAGFFVTSTTAFPLVGTVFTQNVIGGPYAQTVNVANAKNFRNNDNLNLWAAGSPPTISEKAVQVQVPSTTTITAVFQQNHAVGDILQLSDPCADVIVQIPRSPSPSASIFVGAGPTVTNAGVGALFDLSLVATFRSHPFGSWPEDNPANYWVAGNGSDEYLASEIT